ncbi:PRMT5-domain-containing protein [Hymenopellis radicata]|nr:PRMT5-domain-containing protein [Hymenopellis radicata]
MSISLLPASHTSLPAESAYDSLCLQLTTEKWQTRWRAMCIGSGSPKIGGSDTEAAAERWRASPVYDADEVNDMDNVPDNTTLLVSPWMELDASDPWVRHDMGIALRQELAFAAYLSLHIAVLPAPQPSNRAHAPAFARSLHAALSASATLQLAVRIPIYHPGNDFHQPWQTWDLLRTMCEYHPRLSVALDLAPLLPPTLPSCIEAWQAEPISHVFLPASSFISNAKGYPVLPKSTQGLPSLNFILSGTEASLHPKGAPLQPLMDNLQNATYETFEQDPVKYAHYEEAIYRALVDRQDQERIVICVAGAGRGPLVKRALAALGRSKTLNAKVYAVEKNANAWIGLQRTFAREDRVELLFGDMRTVQIPELVDMVVSELLGSFGDNELSPECLDGIETSLKPDGISIPSSYTAHLTPLSSSKLWQEARSKGGRGEEPYVVMFQSVRRLSGDVRECWEFAHPRASTLGCDNGHNVRSAEMVFDIPEAGVLHGFAGYFEAVLYGTVGLSIHPERKEKISRDMLSWFPIYFPIREPLYLPGGSELRVSMWRLTDGKKVWYEWSGEAFLDVGSTGKVNSPHSANLLVPASPTTYAPSSPLVDAVELKFAMDNGGPHPTHFNGKVKIGHTGLHNPSGRSSWIGL